MVYTTSNDQLLVGLESSQDSSVSVDRNLGFIKEDLELNDPDIDWQESRPIGGDRTPSYKVEGQTSFDGGSIPVIPYDGFPLALALGEETFTDNTGNNSHVLTPIKENDRLPPSFTMEASFLDSSGNDFARTFTSEVVNSATISLDNESELVVELDTTCMDVSTSTSASSAISLPDRNAWKFDHVSSNLNMFNTSFAKVMDFEVEIDNSAESEWYINSTQDGRPSQILWTTSALTVSTTVKVTNADIYNELLDPTEGGFKTSLVLEKPGSSEKMDITVSSCNITSAPIAHTGDIEEPEYEVELIGEDITVEVTDSQSSSSYL